MISTNSIERAGTGIERSGAGIERSGTGVERLFAVPVLMAALLLWGSIALAYQNGGTGTSSTGEATTTMPDLSVNGELVTVSFRNGYKAVNGYGYTIKGYTEISLYSLEYIHVMDSGAVQSETVPYQNGGTGGEGSGDGTDNQQLKAWGIAEVVLSERGIADIIVYRFNEEGTLEEVGVYSGVEVH